MFVGVDGIQIEGSPFSVIISPAATHPQSCIATGEGLQRFAAGKTATVFIQARDQFGNQRDQGGDKFSVSINGPSKMLLPSFLSHFCRCNKSILER